MTPLLKTSILLLSAKRKMLRGMQENLKTIVMGSSHGDYGFDPDYCELSFNLCCRSQDLKHSFYLYKHVTTVAPHLKNLVLFYSIFSPGNRMENSPGEKDICPAINELFELGLDYQDEHLATLSNNISGHLANFEFDIDGHAGFFPTTEKFFYPEDYGAVQRANEHLKLNADSEAHEFLWDTLTLAKASGHNVYIVIPPVRRDYKEATGQDFNSLFKDLISILQSFNALYLDFKVNLINGFDDEDFKDEHFGDFDHLLPTGKGAEILTRKINSVINDAGCRACWQPARHPWFR